MAKRSERRNRASRRPQSPPRQTITPTMLAAVAAVVVLAVAVVVIFAQRQTAAKPTPAVTQLPSTIAYPVGKTPEGYYYKGNPDAKVTVFEYSDYQCPICRDYAQTIEPKIDEQFVKTGKAKFVFKDFAFIGDESKTAAQAALCAGEQGRFWEYHNALFENQGQENSGAFSRDKLTELAKTVGLDTNVFGQCLSSGKYDLQVSRSTQEGRNQGVQGTPSTFIGTRKIEGTDFQSIATAIEAAAAAGQ